MRKKVAGLALIQTIIAIVILSLAMAGAVTLMVRVIDETEANQKRITATYLAQECVELVRNARDSAWRQNLPWDCSFPDKALPDDSGYRIWATDALPVSSDQASLCQGELGLSVDIPTSQPYNLSIVGNRFVHEASLDPASATGFLRRVQFSDVVHQQGDSSLPVEQMKATCSVFWPEKRRLASIELATILTDWNQK